MTAEDKAATSTVAELPVDQAPDENLQEDSAEEAPLVFLNVQEQQEWREKERAALHQEANDLRADIRSTQRLSAADYAVRINAGELDE